jgi:hypothetical protein
MEPPTKRPRFGPAPFEEDDPDDDELNSRPEEVNARRDPGLKLERSRAFAAFKFKSALESIFDKYGKDFTGVGDEIDLRTGEIVVDNGHLLSLKDAQIGGEDGEDEDDDGDGGNSENAASEAEPFDEEERKLQGKPDNRLSRLGQLALPPIPPQIGTAPYFGGGWPGPAPPHGGHPGFQSMMYPGQMQFGGFPMQYGAPVPMPTTDPTWSTPELPSPFFGNGVTPGQSMVLVRKKKARLSLTAAREHDDDDNDDILRGLPETGQSEATSGAVVIRRKLLLSRPPPERMSGQKKNKKSVVAGPKQGRNITKPGKHQKAEKSLMKKLLENKPSTNYSTPLGVTPAKPNPDPKSQDNDIGLTGSGTPIPEVTGEEAPETSEAQHSNHVASGSELTFQPGDPDVYVNLSCGQERLTRKPRNQNLRVEIVARKRPDFSSFRSVSPEPSEADSSMALDSEKDEATLEKVPVACESKTSGPKSMGEAQNASIGVFARNVVDPAYAFSDEDEPTLPRKKAPQRKLGKVGNGPKTSAEVVPESHEDMDLGVVIYEGEPTPDEALLDADNVVAVRAPSPTLSVRLDDIMVCYASGRIEPSATDIEGLGQAADTDELNKEETSEWATSRKSMDEAEKFLALQQSPKPSISASEPKMGAERVESPVPKKSEQSFSRKTLQQDTPTSTAGKGGLGTRSPHKKSTNPEIPQTSPEAQVADHPPQASDPPTPALRIQDSDPPFPSSEQPQSSHDTIPSPTLTDPTSEHPQTTPSKQPPPSTPVKAKPKPKAPSNRLPKPSPTAATKTKTTPKPKPTTKRKSLLSLVPPNTNTNNNDSDEDELSIPTHSTPAPATISYLRLTALASGSSSSRRNSTTKKPPPSSTITLKRAILKPTAGNTAGRGGGVSTPLSSGKRRRVAGVYSGSNGGGGGGGGDGKGPRTPTTARVVASEMVQTPGGTMRRCGEGGFRCERDFCFVCL